ncbi:toll-like receptor 8 [Gouania willdenowi]|uniref:Toll-like receptor 8 n=1 Tax=Gouania willdenowi TaxID=441366 RepID=A0A8C5I7D6_GOUWI|nr:toll-like receptor 8 [Gouania willdenowi]
MTVIGWLHMLLLCLHCHYEAPVAASKITWMSRRFPCDVTNNTSQVFFDCKGRHLSKVPSEITENATKLDLSRNDLQSISRKSFLNLHSLVELNLNHATNSSQLKIGKHAFENLKGLRVLRLSSNNLSEIPANIPENVNLLELNSNKITFVNSSTFAGLRKITELFFARNCYSWNPCGKAIIVQQNSFINMNKLQTLKIGYNNLTEVPKFIPKSLLYLSLECNQIPYISKEDFSQLCNLKKLEIQGNCPRCLNAPFPCVPCQNQTLAIHPDAFRSLTQLEILNLGGNSLTFINQSWFEPLKNLKKLLLSLNFLMDVITGEATFLQFLKHLRVIDLSFNYGLKKYPETVNLSSYFSNLTSLETLHMEALVFQKIGPHTFAPLHKLTNFSSINLGTNFIIHSDKNVFKPFKHLRMLYLAENWLHPPPQNKTNNLHSGYDQSSDLSVFIPSIRESHDEEYYLTHGLIKQQCFDSGKVLILSSNNIFFISPAQFEGYGNIACLNLSVNGFSAALNGTEFSLLPNLTYLDLSFNKVDFAFDHAFQELKKLEVLDISNNEHYFKAFGITHNLNFTRNLPVLRVLNMSHNSISRLTTKQMYSNSLAELQFTHNYLGTLWKENDHTYEKLFVNLVNLTVLDISYNSIRKIPANIYQHLPRNLSVLCIAHNLLQSFEWEKLNFHQLQTLDLSNNFLSHIAGIGSNIPRTLTYLDLSVNKIFHLEDGFLEGAKSLTTLSLNHNRLSLVNQSSFKTRSDNQLQTLFLWNNPFQCTCDSLEFILWLESSNIKIPRLTTKVTCGTPENQKGNALIYFEIQQCVDDSQAFLIYLFTTSVTIIFMLAAILSHLFYWDASYIIHYVKARLKGYKSLKSQDCCYSLFVTYDTRDPHVSEWVLRNLRVRLEEEAGEKHLPLCLEERDWPPGVALVDNLAQSIQYSRKTLFVLTEGYIKTGIFKLAMYLAHQRLLDENVDVIVLLMLEPVLQHSHFLRLRRRLCGESVIEWPKTAAAEPWFWQKLKNVVKIDNQVMYSKTYKRYFTSK